MYFLLYLWGDYMKIQEYKDLIGIAITLDKPYGKYITQAQNDEHLSIAEFVELTRYAYDILQEKKRGWRDD